MATEIIIAIIGVVSTVVSWALGRRRTNAEIATMQMDYIKSADTFYRERIDSLQDEVTKQAKQLRALRLIVNKMIDNACLVQKCPKRMYFSPDTLVEILEHEGISPEAYETQAH